MLHEAPPQRPAQSSPVRWWALHDHHWRVLHELPPVHYAGTAAEAPCAKRFLSAAPVHRMRAAARAPRASRHWASACRTVHDLLILVPELGLHCGFVLRVCPWFTPIVTHISSYPFSALLSDPCPTVVLVSNGIACRSPQTRGFDRFVIVIPRGNPGGPCQDH